MLDKGYLEEEFKKCFNNTIPKAFEQAWLAALPIKTDNGDELAENFGKTISELVSDVWAQYMADAIDTYIKNANIHGMLITTGSPTTHICNINSPMPPSAKGVTPNSLGIS